MRTEIRNAYSQFFSIVFGVILTSILGTFYLAIEKHFLFLVIPIMILAWLSIAIIIRLNIQHIAGYIIDIELKINSIAGGRLMHYESNHVKKLWFSPWIKVAAIVPFLALIGIYGLSLYEGFQFISLQNTVSLGTHATSVKFGFVAFFLLLLVCVLYSYIFLPEQLFKKEFKNKS